MWRQFQNTGDKAAGKQSPVDLSVIFAKVWTDPCKTQGIKLRGTEQS